MRATLVPTLLFVSLSTAVAAGAHAQTIPDVPITNIPFLPHLCAPPTLAQCQSESYFETRCGRAQRALDLVDETSTCNQLIASAWLMPFGSSGTTVAPELINPTLAPAPARRITYSGSSMTASGFGGSYHGSTTRQQVNSVRPNYFPGHAVRRTAYEANGAVVNSCEEYAYEKHYTFSRFEDATAGLLGDHRSFFSVAYGDIGSTKIAYDPLRSKSGVAGEQIEFNTELQPRNVFFTFHKSKYSEFDWEEPTAKALYDKLAPGRAVYTHGWDWHRQMSDELSDYADEELYATEWYQERFARLIAEYNALVLQMLLAENPVMTPALPGAIGTFDGIGTVAGPGTIFTDIGGPRPGPNDGPIPIGELEGDLNLHGPSLFAAAAPLMHVRSHSFGGLGASFLTGAIVNPLGLAAQIPSALIDPILDEPSFRELTQIEKFDLTSPSVADLRRTTTRLYELEAKIYMMLQKADELGCLEDEATPCDWSPKVFSTQIHGYFNRVRESQFNRCMTWTKNDFSLLRSFAMPPSTVSEDWTTTTERVDQYVLQATRLSLNAPTFNDPAVGLKKSLGGGKSDSGSIGNENFGLSYAYEASMGIHSNGGRPCESQLTIIGKMSATARAFGKPIEVINFDSRYNSNDNGFEGHTTFSIFGNQFYNDNTNEQGLDFRVVGEPSAKNRVVLASFRFTIGPVPVLVTAGVSTWAGVGINVRGGTSKCPEPRIFADAEVKPFVSADAFATATPDIVLASAGVRAELTIIRADLPLRINVSVEVGEHEPDGTINPNKLRVKGSGSLSLGLSALRGSVVAFVTVLGETVGEKTLISWPGIIFPETKLLELPAIDYPVIFIR